jgi:hypothetical protein
MPAKWLGRSPPTEQAERTGSGFALVLLDAQMPEMGGFTGDAHRCRELGIATYRTKPVTVRPADAIFPFN